MCKNPQCVQLVIYFQLMKTYISITRVQNVWLKVSWEWLFILYLKKQNKSKGLSLVAAECNCIAEHYSTYLLLLIETIVQHNVSRFKIQIQPIRIFHNISTLGDVKKMYNIYNASGLPVYSCWTLSFQRAWQTLRPFSYCKRCWALWHVCDITNGLRAKCHWTISLHTCTVTCVKSYKYSDNIVVL